MKHAQLCLFAAAAPRPAHAENTREQAMILFTNFERWAAGIAVKMARKMPGYGVEDLVQEAKIGLWKAALKYTCTSPVHFSVFAKKWVEGQVLMACRRGSALNAAMAQLDEKHPVNPRYYSNLRELNGKLSRDSQRLMDLLNGGFSEEEQMAQLGIMSDQLAERMERLKREAGSILALRHQI